MNIYLLVHGGTSSGAIWDKVVPLLKKAGHRVYAPDLKGMGTRIDELSSKISLDDYIDDVTNIISQHDLQDIILVGHSVAGLTITAVASKMPERIKKLVYLDALLPDVGSTAFSLLDASVVEWLTGLAKENDGGWFYTPEQVTTQQDFPDEKERNWVLERRSPQPLNVQNTPIYFDPNVIDKISKYYIYCSTDGGMTKKFAKKAKNQSMMGYTEINTGHMAMVTAPEELSRLLLTMSE